MVRTASFALLLLAAHGFAPAHADSFTWSGSLDDGGTAADGDYDFQLQLFAAEAGGAPLGAPVHLPGVRVTLGAFSTAIELPGAAALHDAWIEVAVRGPQDAAWRWLPGRTAVAAKGPGAACPASWNLSGNAGVLAGDFLGTTDWVALQFRAGNQRVLRIDPGATPNLIGGHSGNLVAAGQAGSTIAGGGSVGNINQVQGSFGSIGGGRGNRVDANWGTIGGGRANLVAGSVDSTVGGGSSNQATGQTSTVGGGFDNVASALVATIVGGIGNRASGERASIGAGEGNTASGSSSTVPGGFGNTASGASSVVAGGSNNIASGDGSGVATGTGNRATGSRASVAGGSNNLASGAGAHVAGGRNNVAAGSYSTVGGGEDNCAGARWSWVGGRQARIIASSFPTGSPCHYPGVSENRSEGTFMWAGGDETPMIGLIYEPNSFVVRASGGTYFYSDSNQARGVKLSPNAGDWSSLSDRDSKDDIEALDPDAVLDALVRMPVYRWRWKGEDQDTRHIGPMAQDFHAAYGLNGDDDRHIMSIDTNGVALAAIQGLNQKLERENAALRMRLEALEQHQRQLQRDLQWMRHAVRGTSPGPGTAALQLAGAQ